MTLSFSVDDNKITLSLPQEKQSFLKKFFKGKKTQTLQEAALKNPSLNYALTELKSLSSEAGEEFNIKGDQVSFSHHIASKLSNKIAHDLGLPGPVDLTLATDCKGSFGKPDFKLTYEWRKNGKRQIAKRIGGFLETDNGIKRIPAWLLPALDVADNTHGGDYHRDWAALARFRQALDPSLTDAEHDIENEDAHIAMSAFLRELKISLSDSFSLGKSRNEDETDFEIIPFKREKLQDTHLEEEGIKEENAELSEEALEKFQEKIRSNGASSAYHVGDKHYHVIDPEVLPILNVMSEKQKAPKEERQEFIHNPLPAITRAVEDHLEKTGKLEGLDDITREEMIESFSAPVIIETQEYSERVIGKKRYIKQSTYSEAEREAATWLAEDIPDRLTQVLETLKIPQLEELKEKIKKARENNQTTIFLSQAACPTHPAMEHIINERIALLKKIEEKEEQQEAPSIEEELPHSPIILDTKDNFDALNYHYALTKRPAFIEDSLPAGIKTSLHPHQEESLQAQITSWKTGMPGILNADEQGLGKTLQTISFLRWLYENAEASPTPSNGPILIVAPTSLLENWNAEVVHHCDYHGLGTLIPLYGSRLSHYKRATSYGFETDKGEENLDFSNLMQAISDGNGHKFWMLTTYTTLTNYQHSLSKIPFSAIVFDEIQALKNPTSLRSQAATAMNADYRIGLTGTPIENTTSELWAIMDLLAPSYLGTLKEFNNAYKSPEAGAMTELYERVFKENNGLPPLAFRRLKSQAAKDLPRKRRLLHPRLMPEVQMLSYDNAKVSQQAGGALKMLTHIRSVSVHPALNMDASDEEFIASSARLAACFDILDDIQQKQERVLIFIESLKMQEAFIALTKRRYHLERIDLINGATPIPKRQEIVQRFQKHLKEDQGFDLLVLGPKAAGTGLTLTAATHVIHLSRWWNPAVEEQCNDRVHRIGQKKDVTIHIPLAIHRNYQEESFDCNLQSLMSSKRALAQSALYPMGDTSDDLSSLLKALKAETRENAEEELNLITNVMETLFQRDKQQGVKRISERCWEIEAAS